MRRSNIFAILFLLAATTGFSQATNGFKSPQNNVPTTLFTLTKSDTIVISNIDMLGKSRSNYIPDYKTDLLPKNYKWSNDIRNIESLKKMAMDIHKQDVNGQDMPKDIHYEVVQRVYYNDVPAKK